VIVNDKNSIIICMQELNKNEFTFIIEVFQELKGQMRDVVLILTDISAQQYLQEDSY